MDAYCIWSIRQRSRQASVHATCRTCARRLGESCHYRSWSYWSQLSRWSSAQWRSSFAVPYSPSSWGRSTNVSLPFWSDSSNWSSVHWRSPSVTYLYFYWDLSTSYPLPFWGSSSRCSVSQPPCARAIRRPWWLAAPSPPLSPRSSTNTRRYSVNHNTLIIPAASLLKSNL